MVVFSNVYYVTECFGHCLGYRCLGLSMGNVPEKGRDFGPLWVILVAKLEH